MNLPEEVRRVVTTMPTAFAWAAPLPMRAALARMAARMAARDDAILRIRALGYPADQAAEIVDQHPSRDWDALVDQIVMGGGPRIRREEP